MNEKQIIVQNRLTAWLMRRTPTSGVRRVVPVGAALSTEIGEVRTENQDRVAIARSIDGTGKAFTVAAVADGIGGMRQGAECAAMALASFFCGIAEKAHQNGDPRDWLTHGIIAANTAVNIKFRGDGGSTLAAVFVADNGSTFWASVGDSRVYQANDSELAQLSTDDTIAGQLGRAMDSGVDQSKLLQYIGIGPGLEPSVAELKNDDGPLLLITTDGAHYLDSTPWFGQIIRHAPDPGISARRLVELSKWCGGPDNASAAVILLGSRVDEGTQAAQGILEVWDPFGELQIMLPANQNTAKAPSMVEVVEPPAKNIDPMSTHPAEVVELPRALKPSKKNDRPPRKSKAAGQKRKQPETSGEETAVPQLLIEFPNKSRQ